MITNNIELDVKVKLLEADTTQEKLGETIGTTGQYVNRILKKPPILFGCALLGFGLGLRFFGLGCISGALVGLIIGGIIKALLPYQIISVAVYQDCGKFWEVKQCGR